MAAFGQPQTTEKEGTMNQDGFTHLLDRVVKARPGRTAQWPQYFVKDEAGEETASILAAWVGDYTGFKVAVVDSAGAVAIVDLSDCLIAAADEF